jgi:hypothetical protein
VIWATGFRPDYSWLQMPGVVNDGRVTHRRGVTDVPDLYFLGPTWQHTRGSALLGFVNDDAAYLADHITAQQRAATAAEAGAPAADRLTKRAVSARPDHGLAPLTGMSGPRGRGRPSTASNAIGSAGPADHAWLGSSCSRPLERWSSVWRSVSRLVNPSSPGSSMANDPSTSRVECSR